MAMGSQVDTRRPQTLHVMQDFGDLFVWRGCAERMAVFRVNKTDMHKPFMCRRVLETLQSSGDLQSAWLDLGSLRPTHINIKPYT